MLWYIEGSGGTVGTLADSAPITPPDGKQFFRASQQTGDVVIADISKVLAGGTMNGMTLNSQNTFDIPLFIQMSRDCAADITVRILGRHDGEPNDTQIAMLYKAGVIFRAGIINSMNDMRGLFNNIPNGTEFRLVNGDTFKIQITATFAEDTYTEIAVYSSPQYSSFINLGMLSVNIITSTVGAVPVDITTAEWTDNGDGTYTLLLPFARHGISGGRALNGHFNEAGSNDVSRVLRTMPSS
jgi:hypothetical protein